MNAINWLISKSEYTVLEDGTVSFFFSGTIPAAMKRQIIAESSSYRDCGVSSAYGAEGDTYGWSAIFGARKSTQFTVRFTYNDYTIPTNSAA